MIEILNKIQPLVSLTISIATLAGIFLAVYKFSRDPDVKAHEKISLIEQRCAMLHGNIDNDISLIKNNHLAHIETDISEIKTQIAVIISKLDGK